MECSQIVRQNSKQHILRWQKNSHATIFCQLVSKQSTSCSYVSGVDWFKIGCHATDSRKAVKPDEYLQLFLKRIDRLLWDIVQLISVVCVLKQRNVIFLWQMNWNLFWAAGQLFCIVVHPLRHSRFSDNDSRPFCFPVPTKTLSYDSCVTVTIHHYCLDTCGPCNN